MKAKRILLTSLLLLASWLLRAADGGDLKEMRIEPASTSVAVIGKARLSVEPLTRGNGGLRAPYRVDVSNLPAKDEQGEFTIALTGEDFAKLAELKPVNFSGSAVSQDGNKSAIHGTATPNSADAGAVKIKVESKRGKLVFNSTYQIVR